MADSRTTGRATDAVLRAVAPLTRTAAPDRGEQVLEDISITLNKGELVSLLGISGGGKTTLFNIIAGLSRPDTGHVLLDGEDVTGCPGRVSYMLQKDLLLPYRTIEDNVALPLIVKGMKKREARELASPYFRQFGLEGTQKKYPAQLSGGMRQRAALLRTYLFSGSVALLDEPFSALDMMTKKSVHDWYLKVMDEIHLSTLFITHDIDEAILLSDRIPADRQARKDNRGTHHRGDKAQGQGFRPYGRISGI